MTTTMPEQIDQKDASPARDVEFRELKVVSFDDEESAEVRGIEFRAADPEASDNPNGTLVGHFAVFNRWTEIDSFFEGNFMERIAPGAFKKTFRESADSIKVLFQHGRDAQIGSQPLAKPDVLEEDNVGAYYEAGLFDGIPPLVLDGLRAGVYGASFRFRVTKEEMNQDAKVSKDNPKGLPERTIREVQVMEFGPVTFPAYAEATAGVRSLTDAVWWDIVQSNPTRARELVSVRAQDEPAPEANRTATTAEAQPEPVPNVDTDAKPETSTSSADTTLKVAGRKKDPLRLPDQPPKRAPLHLP